MPKGVEYGGATLKRKGKRVKSKKTGLKNSNTAKKRRRMK